METQLKDRIHFKIIYPKIALQKKSIFNQRAAANLTRSLPTLQLI